MSMLFKRIKDWATSITAFRTGDVIPVDGPSGTAKMPYSDLAKEVIKDSANNTAATEADMVAGSKIPIMTAGGPKALPGDAITPKTYAQNVANSIAPEFDPTRTSENPYLAGESVMHDGKRYVFKVDHYGAWNDADVNKVTLYCTSESCYRLIPNRYVSARATKDTYSNDYDLIDCLPVKQGDVLHINVGKLGCRVLVYDTNGTYFDYYNFTEHIERVVVARKVENHFPNFFKIPISKENRDECFVEVNGKRVFDGRTNGQSTNVINLVNGAFQNLFFIGKGDDFSYNFFYNKFIPGKKYNIDLLTYGNAYADTGSDSSVFKLMLVAVDSNGADVTAGRLVIYQTQTVESHYEFVMPEGCTAVRFGGRIANGVAIVAIPSEKIEESEPQETETVVKLVMSNNFENSTVSDGYPTHNGAANRVCAKDIVLFPHSKGRYKVVAPDGVQLSAVTFSPSQNINSIISWKNSGDVFSINGPDDGFAWRPSFRRKNDSSISVAEVLEWIASGELYVEDLDNWPLNYKLADSMKVASAAKKKLIGERPWCEDLPLIAHVSDLHSDVTRFHNARRIAKEFGAIALVNSGDAVMYKSNAEANFNFDEQDENLPLIFCIGNHESYPTGATQLFERFVQPLVDTNGYKKTLSLDADNCYYFVDNDSKKLRFVALNYYNDGVYNGSLGQTQLDWFVATLASTPQDYGVIVVLHSPEDKITCPENLQTFRQQNRVVTYQENGFYIGDRPIMNIIDAFISKTSGTESYTDGETPVSVSYDFTNLATGVEFICYMCGHRHEDWVGYYDHATNMQLSLGIVTGNAINATISNPAWNNQSDLGRNDGYGESQDAVNLYAIDRTGGAVRVVRVGATITNEFAKREMLAIPYRIQP